MCLHASHVTVAALGGSTRRVENSRFCRLNVLTTQYEPRLTTCLPAIWADEPEPCVQQWRAAHLLRGWLQPALRSFQQPRAATPGSRASLRPSARRVLDKCWAF